MPTDEIAVRAEPPRPFAVTTTKRGSVICIAVEGEIDLATAPQLAAALDGGRPDGNRPDGDGTGGGEIVVDLRGVTFIDSSGLRVLLLASENHEGKFRVIPGDLCLRLFEITGVTDLFVIDND